MKLKNNYLILGAFALLSIFASCSSSYQTSSNFGSRKYTRGYFFNHRGTADNVVAKNNTIKENNQSSPVVSTTINAPTQATSVTVEKTETLPSQVNSVNLSNEVASSSVLPYTSSLKTQKVNFLNSENAPIVESGTSSGSYSRSSSSSFIDFTNHPVRTVLLIILALLIIGILIIALASGNATVTTS